MSRHKAGELMDSYTYTITQPTLNELSIDVKLLDQPRERGVTITVWPVPRKRWFAVEGPGGRISTHRDYSTACSKAHRVALQWLHSALGTGKVRPVKLP